MSASEVAPAQSAPSLPAPTPHDADAIATAREALEIAFGPVPQRSFAVRLWDDSVDRPSSAPVPFTLVVRRAGALRRALLPPSELALVEAYLRDDLDAEGTSARPASSVTSPRRDSDRRARSRGSCACCGGFRRTTFRQRPATTDASAPPRSARLFGLGRHSRRRDEVAVRHHYDVGNDFYELWLDRRLIYSCAYFPTGAEDLDAAQEAKLEHICRKLRLQPGEHLLDVGCGWGGLLEYAATRFGVSGVGITLSEPQAERRASATRRGGRRRIACASRCATTATFRPTGASTRR